MWEARPRSRGPMIQADLAAVVWFNVKCADTRDVGYLRGTRFIVNFGAAIGPSTHICDWILTTDRRCPSHLSYKSRTASGRFDKRSEERGEPIRIATSFRVLLLHRRTLAVHTTPPSHTPHIRIGQWRKRRSAFWSLAPVASSVAISPRGSKRKATTLSVPIGRRTSISRSSSFVTSSCSSICVRRRTASRPPRIAWMYTTSPLM